MTLKRGDIVLVNYPFSSGTGSKLRPALIVQSDHNNQRLTNVIIAVITTTTRRRHEPIQLFIDIGTPAGVQSGLLHNSVVTCENVLTVARSLAHRKLGQLPAATMKATQAPFSREHAAQNRQTRGSATVGDSAAKTHR